MNGIEAENEPFCPDCEYILCTNRKFRLCVFCLAQFVRENSNERGELDFKPSRIVIEPKEKFE